jgi:transcriptional regulator with XRE-family HTH domain
MPGRRKQEKVETKPEFARAIISRRNELGLSLTDIDRETNGVIYSQLLYRVENGKKSPDTLRINQRIELARVLRWSDEKLEAVLGIQGKSSPSLDPVSSYDGPDRRSSNPTPGDRLKKLREGKDLTCEQVAELAGGAVTPRRFSNREDRPGVWHKVTKDEVKKLARAYGMSVINFLDSVNGTPYPAKPNIFTDEVVLESSDIRRNSRLVPEYNMVGVGPGGQDGEILGYIDVPDSWAGDHVGYRVSGDSMSPTIKDSDTVVVRVQSYASAKNIVVCWLPDEGMTCKYLQEKTEDGLHMLTSFNAAHPPIWTRDLKIYGLVREIRSRVELINGNH